MPCALFLSCGTFQNIGVAKVTSTFRREFRTAREHELERYTITLFKTKLMNT